MIKRIVFKHLFQKIRFLKSKENDINKILKIDYPFRDSYAISRNLRHLEQNYMGEKNLKEQRQLLQAFDNIIKKKNFQQTRQIKKGRFFQTTFFIILFYYLYDGLYFGESKDKTGQVSAIQTLLGQSDIDFQTNVQTKFSDVLGIDEFKDELLDIVDYLKNPKKYTDCGAKLPKGILLCGPPGTGKTLLARALAGEAQCSFFYKSGAEFDEMFVGVGAARIRSLFEKARKNSPSIIFIDEIDSIGGKRNYNDSSHSRDTINQILTELDGFQDSDNVIVIGATNFDQVLDPALTRPGRFDKKIQVPLPDVKGRKQIFDYYLKQIKKPFCLVENSTFQVKINFQVEDINSESLAKQTTGFTGADIQNMVNIAILEAIKYQRKRANQSDFESAKDRIRMGIGRKNLAVTDKDKLITAYHEGGHALTSILTKGSTPLHKVTILPRGGALGFTSMVPSNDQQVSQTKRNFISQIDVAMGGRAAEELLMGDKEISSGCSSDLQNATNIAYKYVMQFGMNEEFSLIALTEKGQASDKYQFIIDQEVQKMLKESYSRVKDLLHQNYDVLQKIANELILKETLLAEEVIKLTQK